MVTFLSPKIVLQWMMAMTLLKVGVGGVEKEKLCQGHPADVVFLLDSSGSIQPRDFQRQLEFVNDVIDLINVTPDVMTQGNEINNVTGNTHDVITQVGVASFSNWAFEDFRLGDFRSVTSMRSAVRRVRQVHGDTNTAAALALLQDVCFKPGNGARPGVPHVGVILTDGRSNIPGETVREARRARGSGIHIFAIGVGDDVDHAELRSIASSPADQNVFTVGSYSALKYIKEILAIETCKLPEPTTTTSAPSAEKLEVKKGCGAAPLVDVVFSTAPTASPTHTEMALQFYKGVVSQLPLVDGNIHIGMVPRHCPHLPDIKISDNMEKSELMEELKGAERGERGRLADVVKHMRRISFSEKQGARPSARKVAVLMVDSNDHQMAHAQREAKKMRAMKNMEIFVVAIGNDVGQSDLDMLATPPAEGHVIRVDSYNQLSLMVDKLTHALCPGLIV